MAEDPSVAVARAMAVGHDDFLQNSTAQVTCKQEDDSSTTIEVRTFEESRVKK